MKTKRIKYLLTWLIALAFCLPAFAQPTAFTYASRLNNNNAVANGWYDLQFALFEAAAAGNPVGSALTTNAVAVNCATNLIVRPNFG